MSVHLSCGSREQSIRSRKSQVEKGDEIVFEHDFEFVILVVLCVKGFKQSPRVGACGKERRFIPAV